MRGRGTPGCARVTFADHEACVLYIANVDEEGFENNPYLDAVTEIAEADGSELVAICNKLEAEIAELEEDEKREFLADLGMTEPGLDRVIRAGYKLLGFCKPTSQRVRKKSVPGLFVSKRRRLRQRP